MKKILHRFLLDDELHYALQSQQRGRLHEFAAKSNKMILPLDNVDILRYV